MYARWRLGGGIWPSRRSQKLTLQLLRQRCTAPRSTQSWVNTETFLLPVRHVGKMPGLPRGASKLCSYWLGGRDRCAGIGWFHLTWPGRARGLVDNYTRVLLFSKWENGELSWQQQIYIINRLGQKVNLSLKKLFLSLQPLNYSQIA